MYKDGCANCKCFISIKEFYEKLIPYGKYSAVNNYVFNYIQRRRLSDDKFKDSIIFVVGIFTTFFHVLMVVQMQKSI